MPSIAKDSSQSVIRITEHLEQVQKRVALAAEKAGRNPRSVRILAVSKQQPTALIRAAVDAGQHAFGENYLQEALAKINELRGVPIQWHFIGRVQGNKTRPIAENFAWLHTVDRDRIVTRLHAQRPAHLPALNVCIQVKLGEEKDKGGVSPSGVPALAELIAQHSRLKLRGLMCMPPVAGPAETRGYFQQLRQLYEQLLLDGCELDTLSMGMSADLEIAVSEGSTIVRIGTAIFGPRPQPKK